MANIFSKLFKKKTETKTNLSLYNQEAIFTSFTGTNYESDIFRSAVDSIARNTAKLKGIHIVLDGKERKKATSRLNYILQERPNPFMSAYDLIYKLVTHYYLYNNAFAYLERDDKGNLLNIWPIKSSQMNYLVDGNNDLYCRFILDGYKEFIFPFRDIFTIRRFFNNNDLLGDDNKALTPLLNLAHIQSEGMEKAIKNGNGLKGILKYSQILAPHLLKELKDNFVEDYINMTNGSGIGALDQLIDFQQLKPDVAVIEGNQLKSVKDKIYEYLGITEKIVNSSYNEVEWTAFYESVIEPLSLQMSLELTEKVFTKIEKEHGNKIIFEANRLNYASAEAKTTVIKELMPLGILTINQALEILNMPPVEDGDKRIQTLNVVNTELVDKYQVNNIKKEGDVK